MAGDWIKMRVDLEDDPAVIAVATALELRDVTVVGLLHKLWGWADRHTVDGVVRGVAGTWIDTYLSAPGFAEAMAKVGWLTLGPDRVIFPNFSRHNGQSAKQRAQTARRVAASRARNAPSVTAPLPREEQRRGEQRGETETGGRAGGRAYLLSWDEVIGNDALRLAREVDHELNGTIVKGGNRYNDRRALLAACLAVADCVLPEAWLTAAVARTKAKRPRNIAAALTAELKRGAEQAGEDFRGILDAADRVIPSHVLAGDPPKGNQATGADPGESEAAS